jgi:hypothetical protein
MLNTPQLNREHNRAPCPTAPSAHASYKGYGCNNQKSPRPPYRNTMIDVVVLRCGPIRTGEGAAAPFIGVHILGEIRPAGGFDTLAKSRWEDRIGPSIPVQKFNHTTINHRGPLNVRRIGRGTERRPCMWRRKLGGIFDAWGGGKHGQLVTGWSISMVPPALTPKKHHNQPRIGSVGAESPRERRSGCIFWRAFFRNYGQRGGFKASLNCHRADKFDRSARSLASKT